MKLDTPEGRYAASQVLGPDGYNKAMADHIKASTVATVNGYSLRWVASRFGRLCSIVEAGGIAFRTLDEAKAHANGLPPFRAPPDRCIDLDVSRREDSFLIAAIRLWQQVERGTFKLVGQDGREFGVDHFEDIASCAYEYPALDAAEVDDLACDVFGCDPWLTEDERAETVAARSKVGG